MHPLKFNAEKMEAVKKPTSDPSIPLQVRNAKNIARDILGKAQAGKLETIKIR